MDPEPERMLSWRIETTEVVSMHVQERVSSSGGANGMRYGWECSHCQGSTGLRWDLEHVAQADLDEHLRTEHPGLPLDDLDEGRRYRVLCTPKDGEPFDFLDTYRDRDGNTLIFRSHRINLDIMQHVQITQYRRGVTT